VAALKKPKRKALTKKLERQVIVEAGGKCPWCSERVTAAEIEIHHIDEDRSNNELSNLILTCRNHHGQIGAKLIPHWDVIVKKQLLCNPAVAERLGLNNPKAAGPGPAIYGDNHGIAAKEVHIGTVKIGRQGKGKRATTPGLIEADPDMRTHANYLVKRYILCARTGRSSTNGASHRLPHTESSRRASVLPGSVLLIPQKRFLEWVAQAQRKINGTVFGQQNRAKGNRNYHSWEEHLIERHGPA
jgi:hypothetical protein